jgi:lipoprotein-releasing system permease protein
MEDFWSQSTFLIILSLFYSVVLTWLIGLLPVILIRYFLIHRPLSKTSSKILVCVFWIINLVMFFTLGSKSHTHVALYLVGLVSYFIYRTNKSLKVLLSDIFFTICFWRSLSHLSLFLWLRYLRKKKIVFLSIAAVALSVALLVVVANLFGGFINVFEQSAVKAIGDIVLEPPVKFSKYEELIRRLEKINAVESAAATLSSEGLLHLSKGNVRGVEIWGVSSLDTRFSKLERISGNEYPVSRDEQQVSGFVGIGVVAEPDEETDEYDFDAVKKFIGQEAVLTTGAIPEDRGRKTEDGERKNLIPEFRRRTVKFTIADFVFTGVYHLDKKLVYLPIEELQKVLYPNEGEGIAGQIQIKLRTGAKADAALVQIRRIWEDFAAEQLGWEPYLIRGTAIVTAKQMQSRYVAEFRKQMGILLLIFGIVSLTAVLLVFCIFYMIVETRKRDIAIIKSCGATNGSVASIFVGFGICVGLVGSGIGMILGDIITRNINAIEEWIRVIFGLKLWKSSVYMFSKIPSEVDWDSALLIALSAVFAATVGALIPAIIAMKTRPVNVLRYE